MPAITARAARPPLLSTLRLSHGTLECDDIRRTRRFYEEVLGLECVQTGPRSLMIRLGTDHTYAVIETRRTKAGMPLLNHNGLDVERPEDVDEAYRRISEIKEEWGLRKLQRVTKSRGEASFYFQDFDGNWWEILAPGPGGYVRDFEDPNYDVTGRHDLEGQLGTDFHTHDPACREIVAGRQRSSSDSTP